MASGILDEFVTVLGLDIQDEGLSSFNSGLTSTIGKMGAVVAGAVSAAAAISDFLSTAADTNQGAKFARSIDLGFDALQRLEFASKRYGIEAGTLRGVLAGLETGARDAAAGMNEGFSEALGTLGIGFRNASGELKDAEQLFFEIADAVANAQNQDNALSFASRLGFGLEFSELLKSGSEGIRALGREAKALGVIFDQSTVRAAERFGESMDTLKTTLSAFLFEQGAPLLEWATDASKAFLDFARSPAFDELKGKIGAVGDGISRVIENSGKVLGAVNEASPRENGVRDLAVTSGAVGLAYLHPVLAALAAIPLALDDFQRFREGEEGTFIGGFLPGLYASFVEKPMKILDSVLGPLADGALSNPNVLPGTPAFAFPGGGGTSQTINVTNEVNIHGNADAALIRAELDGMTPDSIRESLDSVRSPVER